MADGPPLRRNPRPGLGAKPTPRRAVPPKKASTPLWMWGVLIVLPAVLIGVLFFYNQSGDKTEAPVAKPKTVNPNERIDKLQAEVDKIEKEVKQIHQQRGSGDASAKAKATAARDRIERWMAEWDEIMKPLLDEEGRLPAEYRGYQASRGRINTARLDLMKIMEFE